MKLVKSNVIIRKVIISNVIVSNVIISNVIISNDIISKVIMSNVIISNFVIRKGIISIVSVSYGTAHFTQMKLKPFDGSYEKVNKTKFWKTNYKETVII